VEVSVFNQMPELRQRATRVRSVAEPGIPRPAFRAGGDAARAETHVTQAEMDATLEDSFPASDPPSWTAAIARPVPRRPFDADAAVRRVLRDGAA
jgi:hypothetical protein